MVTVQRYRDRYQTRFNSPRMSTHEMRDVRFLPFNKLDSRLDGLAVQIGGPCDLLHAHNRVPLVSKRFIATHESGVPRLYGLRADSLIGKLLQNRLRSGACRRIIAMSHYGNREMHMIQQAYGAGDELAHKQMVRHPNIDIPDMEDLLVDDDFERLRIVFVGGHFGRKGGCSVVRLAEMVNDRNLPIDVTIVSSLVCGDSVWTDPTDPDFFEPYLNLLSLPNVTFHKTLPNDELRALMATSHFSALPTLADTFGFSTIESMASYTPVIGTAACALPEFIADDVNGILVDLPVTPTGRWDRPDYNLRHTARYATYYRDTVETVAEALLQRLEPMIGAAERNRDMRRMARHTAKRQFCAQKASEDWDRLYDRVVQESTRDPVILDPVEDWSSPEHPVLDAY
ncbi:MAG: glycosyltransferase family 4 protein [Pseudomonadota bacterium]